MTNWQRLEILGSEYEHELDVDSGRIRHRPRQMELPLHSHREEPWMPFLAPDTVYHQAAADIAEKLRGGVKKKA